MCEIFVIRKLDLSYSQRVGNAIVFRGNFGDKYTLSFTLWNRTIFKMQDTFDRGASQTDVFKYD